MAYCQYYWINHDDGAVIWITEAEFKEREEIKRREKLSFFLNAEQESELSSLWRESDRMESTRVNFLERLAFDRLSPNCSWFEGITNETIEENKRYCEFLKEQKRYLLKSIYGKAAEIRKTGNNKLNVSDIPHFTVLSQAFATPQSESVKKAGNGLVAKNSKSKTAVCKSGFYSRIRKFWRYVKSGMCFKSMKRESHYDQKNAEGNLEDTWMSESMVYM
ncbi:hypothetical protein ScPMuIL_014532 [Solemya velum]